MVNETIQRTCNMCDMCSQCLQMQLSTSQIPREFIDHSRIGQVLHHVISEFNPEEQAVIYLYHLVKLPIDEIVTLTELANIYVVSILVMYSQKLTAKVELFKEALPYDKDNLVSVGELLETGVE